MFTHFINSNPLWWEYLILFVQCDDRRYLPFLARIKALIAILAYIIKGMLRNRQLLKGLWIRQLVEVPLMQKAFVMTHDGQRIFLKLDPERTQMNITVTSRECHCVANKWQLHCLFNSLFRLKTKGTSNLHITDPLCGESTSENAPMTSGGFTAQRGSYTETVSLSWRH